VGVTYSMGRDADQRVGASVCKRVANKRDLEAGQTSTVSGLC
jgi:hypothetical protein